MFDSFRPTGVRTQSIHLSGRTRYRLCHKRHFVRLVRDATTLYYFKETLNGIEKRESESSRMCSYRRPKVVGPSPEDCNRASKRKIRPHPVKPASRSRALFLKHYGVVYNSIIFPTRKKKNENYHLLKQADFERSSDYGFSLKPQQVNPADSWQCT